MRGGVRPPRKGFGSIRRFSRRFHQVSKHDPPVCIRKPGVSLDESCMGPRRSRPCPPRPSCCLFLTRNVTSPSLLNAATSQPGQLVTLDSAARNWKVGALHQVNLRTVSWKPRKPSTGTGSGQATLISTPLHHATPTSRATFRGGTLALQFYIAKSARERIPFEPTNYPQPETNRASSTRFFEFLCPISDDVFESQVALQPRLLTVRCIPSYLPS
jgi:hypothetical protein